MVFNSTISGRVDFKREEFCHIKDWSLKVGRKGKFLNTGVYIGKAEAIRDIFEEAIRYVDGFNGAEQPIVRGIHPSFKNLIAVDYKNELCYRN